LRIEIRRLSGAGSAHAARKRSVNFSMTTISAWQLSHDAQWALTSAHSSSVNSRSMRMSIRCRADSQPQSRFMSI